jgi:hypothetical protein
MSVTAGIASLWDALNGKDSNLLLIDSVTGTVAGPPYVLAWSLLGLGFLFSVVATHVRRLKGEAGATFYAVLGNTAVYTVALVLFVPLSRAAFWASDELCQMMRAAGPSTDGFTLTNFLKAARMGVNAYVDASRVGGGAFNPLGMLFGAGGVAWLNVKLLIFDFSAFMAFFGAYLATWDIRQLQIMMFNVLFCFGPLLIALASFGLPSFQLWIRGLLEVVSWGLAATVVRLSSWDLISRYVSGALTKGEVGFREMVTVLTMLSFMTGMMFAIPIVASRFFGFGEVSALAGAQVNSWAGSLGQFFASSAYSGRDDLGVQPVAPSSSNGASGARPGDA